MGCNFSSATHEGGGRSPRSRSRSKRKGAGRRGGGGGSVREGKKDDDDDFTGVADHSSHGGQRPTRIRKKSGGLDRSTNSKTETTTCNGEGQSAQANSKRKRSLSASSKNKKRLHSVDSDGEVETEKTPRRKKRRHTTTPPSPESTVKAASSASMSSSSSHTYDGEKKKSILKGNSSFNPLSLEAASLLSGSDQTAPQQLFEAPSSSPSLFADPLLETHHLNPRTATTPSVDDDISRSSNSNHRNNIPAMKASLNTSSVGGANSGGGVIVVEAGKRIENSTPPHHALGDHVICRKHHGEEDGGDKASSSGEMKIYSNEIYQKQENELERKVKVSFSPEVLSPSSEKLTFEKPPSPLDDNFGRSVLSPSNVSSSPTSDNKEEDSKASSDEEEDEEEEDDGSQSFFNNSSSSSQQLTTGVGEEEEEGASANSFVCDNAQLSAIDCPIFDVLIANSTAPQRQEWVSQATLLRPTTAQWNVPKKKLQMKRWFESINKREDVRIQEVLEILSANKSSAASSAIHLHPPPTTATTNAPDAIMEVGSIVSGRSCLLLADDGDDDRRSIPTLLPSRGDSTTTAPPLPLLLSPTSFGGPGLVSPPQLQIHLLTPKNLEENEKLILEATLDDYMSSSSFKDSSNDQ